MGKTANYGYQLFALSDLLFVANNIKGTPTPGVPFLVTDVGSEGQEKRLMEVWGSSPHERRRDWRFVLSSHEKSGGIYRRMNGVREGKFLLLRISDLSIVKLNSNPCMMNFYVPCICAIDKVYLRCVTIYLYMCIPVYV